MQGKRWLQSLNSVPQPIDLLSHSPNVCQRVEAAFCLNSTSHLIKKRCPVVRLRWLVQPLKPSAANINLCTHIQFIQMEVWTNIWAGQTFRCETFTLSSFSILTRIYQVMRTNAAHVLQTCRTHGCCLLTPSVRVNMDEHVIDQMNPSMSEARFRSDILSHGVFFLRQQSRPRTKHERSD